MDALLRKHQSLIFSTLYMVLGLMAAGYATVYSGKEAMIKDLRKVHRELKAEKKQLEELKKKESEETDKSKEDKNSLPVFLTNINRIAQNNKVIIRELSPNNEDNQLKFQLQLITDYFSFIRFTSELEALDIILDDIQLHPYDNGRTPPMHAISFSLIPRNNASPLSDDVRLKNLQEWVNKTDRRNPFQRFAYDTTLKRVRPVIDLTWIHKLSGLGRTKSNQKYASISRKKYFVGSKLDGLIITAIDEKNKQVSLEKRSEDGKVRYTLGFRQRSGEKR
jgi:hypothetical protein